MTNFTPYIEGAAWAVVGGGWLWANWANLKFRNVRSEIDQWVAWLRQFREHADGGGFITVSIDGESLVSSVTGWARIGIVIRNQDPFDRRFGPAIADNLMVARSPGKGTAEKPVHFAYTGGYHEGMPAPEYIRAEAWIKLGDVPNQSKADIIQDRSKDSPVPEHHTSARIIGLNIGICDQTGKPTGQRIPLLRAPGFSTIILVTNDRLEPQR
jgi:hypothetical protein